MMRTKKLYKIYQRMPKPDLSSKESPGEMGAELKCESCIEISQMNNADDANVPKRNSMGRG